MNEQDQLANKIALKIIADDLFGQWLGVELVAIKEGYSKILLRIRPEMINAIGIAHGGIVFSLADTALALACNGRNKASVTLESAINFIKPVYENDTITAETTEIHNGQSTGLYQITITNQAGSKVAVFKGTCFRTGKAIV
ncbi:MAG: hotdog fold thioesterase [Bacteroidetes bacterium]|nr:hotdog fold thioesterase [Bacteroidota bacterium]